VTVRNRRRLPAEELAPYQLDVPPAYRHLGGGPPDPAARPPAPIDWRALFGNDHPVEIEVGFGKGLFLLTAGLARPDVNFFGIEIVRKYQLYATQRIAVRKLPNVKTCCGDARRILRDLVPPGSVAAVHVYFPDPWWKSRHKKRLLFTPDFAATVLAVLAPGGQLHFVSDVADYHAMVTGTLDFLPGFARLPPPDASAPAHDMDYLTNFERKFRKEGRPIHRARYEKSPGHPERTN
jgi:tRNA (guanine-N7-)-methyltransferase